MNLRVILPIVFCLVIVTACSSEASQNLVLDSQPISPTTPLDTDLCQKAFDKASQLSFEIAANFSQVELSTIQEGIDAIVLAGEDFLNNCAQSDQSLSAQQEILEKFRQLQLIPKSQRCGYRYSSDVQVIDFDNDDIDELVFHTQFARCDIYNRYGFLGSGALSIVYHFNPKLKKWQGFLIWPCDEIQCPWLGSMDQTPGPLVKSLVTRDEPQHPLMLVEGGYLGADHDGKILTVWSWKSIPPEIILQLRFTDWCGRSSNWEIGEDGEYIFNSNWEITEEGYIFVPTAEKTERCPVEAAQTYILRGNEFIVE